MALVPDPIFFRKLERGAGGRRNMITISNTEVTPVRVKIVDVEKPEWIELEGIAPGAVIEIGPKKRVPVIVDVNTTHKYFPTESSYEGAVVVELEGEKRLEVSIIIQEITQEISIFRGVFAVDFGTTNTCFAYKHKLGDKYQIEDALRRARSSPEIPSLVFFRDVSNRENPDFVIGNEAKYDIKEFSSQTYSYFMSVKRLLGEDKSFIVLDRHAGSRKEHRQKWHVTEVAALIVRDILRRAEETIGEKITQVVATYPTLFSRDRKEAMRRAFQNALRMRGVDVTESGVIMDLDETSAAAFNYIYGTLVEEFRRFATVKKECQLLVYDFGGGTIDVSLVGVDISRDQTGRLHIKTELRGLTGEGYYGGDNVTLAVFGILKKRLALTGAKVINEKYEAEKKAAEEKEEEWDPFSAKAKRKKKDEEEEWDPFKAAEQEKKAKEEEKMTTAVTEEEMEGLEDIINIEDQNVWRQAIEALARERTIVEKSIADGTDILTAVVATEKADKTYVAQDQSQRRAEVLEKALETVVPTKWTEYEDSDPLRSELARKLFYDIWHEADLLKIRLSKDEKGAAKVSGVLKKIAKYAGVDPIAFNEVSVTMEELNKQIEQRVTETIKKAYNLYQSVREEEKGGIAIKKGASDAPELRVILCGNSSNLPIVKQKVLEVFKINENELIMNKSELKTGTAVGACEEYMLRRDFGESGLIRYTSKGFLERLPCSVGLFNRDLILQGYDRGFCPVFPRGTEVNSQKVLDEKNYFLIHPRMTELALYADYHDGAMPTYIGWFDFTSPSGQIEGFSPDPDAEKILKIRVELLENRDIRAVNLRTGHYFNLIPKKEAWKPEEYPFSGLH